MTPIEEKIFAAECSLVTIETLAEFLLEQENPTIDTVFEWLAMKDKVLSEAIKELREE